MNTRPNDCPPLPCWLRRSLGPALLAALAAWPALPGVPTALAAAETAPAVSAPLAEDLAATGPLLVYFHQRACPACRTFEEQVALDETLAVMAAGVPLLQADLGSAHGARLAAQLGATSVPTLLILSPGKPPVALTGTALTSARVALELARLKAPGAPPPLQLQTPKPAPADVARLRAALLAPPPAPVAAVLAAPAQPSAATPAPAAPRGLELLNLREASGPSATLPAGSDLQAVRVALADGQLLIDVTYNAAAGERLQLFFNVDGEAPTGFSSTHLKGADLMLEGLTLYRFGGAKADAWTWKPVGPVESRREGTRVQLRLPLDRVGLKAGQTVGLAAQSFDEKYAALDFLPASGSASFRLPDPLP